MGKYEIRVIHQEANMEKSLELIDLHGSNVQRVGRHTNNKQIMEWKQEKKAQWMSWKQNKKRTPPVMLISTNITVT